MDLGYPVSTKKNEAKDRKDCEMSREMRRRKILISASSTRHLKTDCIYPYYIGDSVKYVPRDENSR
jgi:hypothetical protein